MYEKHKARLCIKQFVICIEKQTRQSVKRLRLDSSQEFGIRELESQTKKKKIKKDLTVTYCLKMNNIAEYTNGLLASKARCLLLNVSFKIGQLFWLEAFTTALYLLNRSLLSFLENDCLLIVWLRAYNSSTESYTLNLGHLGTFGYQVYTQIPDKRG